MSLKQGASDEQISKYCRCVAIQLADNKTYNRLASDSTAPDQREYLKQQAEAARQDSNLGALNERSIKTGQGSRGHSQTVKRVIEASV
jgi:hypothetical protein